MYLISLSQKVNTQSRNKLYYSKYEYCLQFYFAELSSIRNKTHAGVDEALAARSWMREVNFGGSWQYRRKRHEITEELIQDCHTLLDYFIRLPENYKLIISMDTGYFYTNSLQDITDLLNFPSVVFEQLKQAVVDIPENSIIIKSANHDFRTYFKSQFLSSLEHKNNLMEMLYNQKDIRLGPSMQVWFERFTVSKYLCDNYFVDHNDMGLITMIHLTCPVKIKHTLNIIRDK